MTACDLLIASTCANAACNSGIVASNNSNDPVCISALPGGTVTAP